MQDASGCLLPHTLASSPARLCLHVCVLHVCVSVCPAGLLASAGWDGRLCYWDPRSPAHAGPVLSVTLPGKAYSLTATNSHVIVGTSGRHLVIFSINQ